MDVIRSNSAAISEGLTPGREAINLQPSPKYPLVVYVANQQDRRSCRITLTSTGQDELKRLTEIGLVDLRNSWKIGCRGGTFAR